MVQDQLRDFSTSWHGKNMHEEILDLQEIFRELLRLRNSWKTSFQIISWFQRIQMEIIMVKRSRNFALFFLWSRNRHTGSSSWPKPIQMKKFTRGQSLRIFYRITTGPWRNLGRRHTWQTLCRLWVTSCFPSRDLDNPFLLILNPPKY